MELLNHLTLFPRLSTGSLRRYTQFSSSLPPFLPSLPYFLLPFPPFPPFLTSLSFLPSCNFVRGDREMWEPSFSSWIFFCLSHFIVLIPSYMRTDIYQYVRTHGSASHILGLKPQLVHVLTVSISGTSTAFAWMRMHMCACPWQHVMIIIACIIAMVFEAQLHKAMLYVWEASTCRMDRATTWLHSVHEIAVPISQSPQRSWWGVAWNLPYTVDDFVKHFGLPFYSGR